MKNLITQINGEARVSHRVIAENVGVQAKNVKELISKYKDQLNSFGVLTFQTEAVSKEKLKQNPDAKPIEHAFLNEQQATLLLTFLKNNDVVVKFKVALVKAFYDLKANLTPMEMIAQIATRMAKMEKLEQNHALLNKRASRLENNINRTLANENYFTIIGYANLKGIEAGKYHTPSLGRRAKKLSKDKGYVITSVPDSKYGAICVYHKDILAQVFEEKGIIR